MATKTKHTANTCSIRGNTAAKDGKTHINIHTRGKTELGRKLSHFAHTPFIHPYFGSFYSMEGLWYYLRSGQTRKKEGTPPDATAERLRFLSGYRAKVAGKTLPYSWYEEFKEDIMAANYQKIIQTPGLCEEFVKSELPFDHYYTFGEGDVVVTPNNYDWLCEGFDDIREAMKNGEVPKCWINAEKRYTPSE